MTTSANKICEEIIRKVATSNLNYQINQTPYSVYLSIRKKFVKEYEPSNEIVPNEISKDVTAIENENLYIRSEYEKLATLYSACLASKTSLESEMKGLEAEFNHFKEAEGKRIAAEIKRVNGEKKVIETKQEKIMKENKELKNEVSDLKKEKNTLSVAVKGSRKEIGEHNKRHDAKIREFEKKIVELSEYRNKRLTEDRALRIKEKKDIKKAAKTSLLSNPSPVTCFNCNNNCVTTMNMNNNNITATNYMAPSLNTCPENTKLDPTRTPSKNSTSTASSSDISTNWNPTLSYTELTITSNTCTTTSITNPTSSAIEMLEQPIMMTDEYFFEKYLKPLQEGKSPNLNNF